MVTHITTRGKTFKIINYSYISTSNIFLYYEFSYSFSEIQTQARGQV